MFKSQLTNRHSSYVPVDKWLMKPKYIGKEDYEIFFLKVNLPTFGSIRSTMTTTVVNLAETPAAQLQWKPPCLRLREVVYKL